MEYMIPDNPSPAVLRDLDEAARDHFDVGPFMNKYEIRSVYEVLGAEFVLRDERITEYGFRRAAYGLQSLVLLEKTPLQQENVEATARGTSECQVVARASVRSPHHRQRHGHGHEHDMICCRCRSNSATLLTTSLHRAFNRRSINRTQLTGLPTPPFAVSSGFHLQARC